MGYDRDIEGWWQGMFPRVQNHEHSTEIKEHLVERVGILLMLRKTKNYYTIKQRSSWDLQRAIEIRAKDIA